MMQTDCTYVTYDETGYFSKIVSDYLSGNNNMKPFYEHEVSVAGVRAAIQNRRLFNTNRKLLVQVLQAQYAGLEMAPLLQQHIQQLGEDNTFTITTAHQPNIFTGPFYFAYKILHTVKLAATLAKELPDCNFVPVYYMGSEDADLDEVGTATIQGKKYQWKTSQTGAVGRMKVDKAFLQLMTEMRGQLGVQPFGEEVVNLFQTYYTEGISIQQATLGLVNALFGEYGVVVLVPDHPEYKSAFAPVLEKELREQFSHKAVSETLEQLSKHYKVQAGGRDINLFYLTDTGRERIEFPAFTLEQLLDELKTNPERFSPNVILRGVLQETLLPDVAFIGGGGELAYWLELKKVFAAAGVPYPVLVLRNSFVWVEEKRAEQLADMGLDLADWFMPMHDQMNKITRVKSENATSLEQELAAMKQVYSTIEDAACKVDKSLHQHVQALRTQTMKKLEQLEKKMLRAEKRKFVHEGERLEQIRKELFPDNNLQERVENMSNLYARYGKEMMDVILQHSLALEQRFGVITIR
ncbi:bacillithiol biosynthesis cysteine-adding enzyme BshC [Filimonas zeae]|nr:bacillithiol biosynthesis cysteine-adding enzyme BshC [Filimonas zeae]MDR6338413.1 bacillithiol biosynthesis cysteine-adding enzyme BshC [Filimonas zeae]